jgi:hypothetical protein
MKENTSNNYNQITRTTRGNTIRKGKRLRIFELRSSNRLNATILYIPTTIQLYNCHGIEQGEGTNSDRCKVIKELSGSLK